MADLKLFNNEGQLTPEGVERFMGMTKKGLLGALESERSSLLSFHESLNEETRKRKEAEERAQRWERDNAFLSGQNFDLEQELTELRRDVDAYVRLVKLLSGGE